MFLSYYIFINEEINGSKIQSKKKSLNWDFFFYGAEEEGFTQKGYKLRTTPIIEAKKDRARRSFFTSAEEEGFEPSVQFLVRLLSKQVP